MEKTNVIKISREFSNSQLGNLWLGREIQIGEGADPIRAFGQADEELRKAYERLIEPQYSGYMVGEPNGKQIPSTDLLPTIQVSKKEEALNNFIEAIQTSTTKKGVEIFRPLVERENNPRLTEVFETTLNRLQQ